MKKFFSEKVFIALLFFCLGGLSLWGIESLHQRISAHRPPAQAQKIFTNPLQDSDDFFTKMQKDVFDRSLMALPSDWQSGNTTQMQERQDEHFVYFDFDFGQQKPKQLNVSVEDGQVTVSAQVESRQEESGSQQFFSSSFQQSFPVPEGVNAADFKTEHDGSKIVIKFPKKQAS